MPSSSGVGAAAVVAAAFAALVAPAELAAQATIAGTVRDAASGAPIAGALVVIGDEEATTAADGSFAVAARRGARVDVAVVADGYEAYFGGARAGARLAIRLVAAAGSSEVIRLHGQAPVQPALALERDAIRVQPGAGNDVLRALQSLPGVARIPFGLGGLALRGAAPRDTKVFLDGIEVPLLYHFGGVASFLPTAIVDDLTLEPGGAGARYGRGVGGVAVVSSRTGRRDRWRAGGELSLLHGSAVGEGPGPLAGSWLVGVRRSYVDAILRAADLEQRIVPRYLDAQLRWESGDHRWLVLLIGSDDDLALVPDDSEIGIDTSSVTAFDYRARFARLGLRYRAARGPTTVTVLPSVGVDEVDARADHKGVGKRMHRVTVPLSLRADLTTPAIGGTLAFGVDVTGQRHAYDLLSTPPPTPADPSPTMVIPRSLTRWATDAGAWLEQAWSVADDRLELRVGLRGDHLGLSDQWTLDPRLAANVRLADGTRIVRAAVGRYHAPAMVTDHDPIFGDRDLPGASAVQASATVEQQLAGGRQVAATAYYHRFAQLPVDAISAATPLSANGGSESGGLLGVSRELVDSQFGSYSYREAIGRGHAYGLELLARKVDGPWTGWIAYTYSRSFRRNPRRDHVDLPYVLDQPHALTVVASRAIGARWRLGGRFRYVTGNPITPVDGAFVDADGDWTPVDGPLLSERLPDFVQLDLRVDRTWRRSWGTLAVYLDVQNVTDRANPEGVIYDQRYTRRTLTSGLPVFPSLGVEYVP